MSTLALPPDHPALGAILALMHARTGTDFSRYRSSTIARRVLNRMISLGKDSLPEYLDLLREDQGETLHLLNRVTIKVSRFYRNAVTFDALRDEVLPQLAADAGHAPLRLWSAGCGCGEEPYTLAMLLEDAGIPGFVHATDIDPAALDVALKGRYAPAAVEELPEALRDRHLLAARGGYEVSAALRARVHFSLHDLGASAPPPGAGFDLVLCRNVLIYFKPEAQRQALHTVLAAVRAGGFLCLGEAEWPSPPAADSLQALSHQSKIFHLRHPAPAYPA